MTRTATPAVMEHRLAVVMNGGVSLAVWMGGVAYELDLLRRASSGLSGPPAGPDPSSSAAQQRVFELWRSHAAAVHTRFRVDVIAGSSAGGLNGVLLATAIASGAPLDGLRRVWIDVPNLTGDGLLRQQGARAVSVLDGDYFEQQIIKAISDLRALRDPAERADVALTTTATALQGAPRVARDRTGAQFSEPDHRRRFDFRRVQHAMSYDGRGGFDETERDDFTDAGTLGTAARASASFPVAFAPVEETPTLRARRTFPTWLDESPYEFLADGGILDNSPFVSVLDAIAAQPVESAWTRSVCYVVPSSDDEISPVVSPGATPPPWTSVLSAALGLPRESGLRDDTEQMHDLIRAGHSSADVARFSSLVEAEHPGDLARAVDLARAGFDLYRQSRAAAGAYEVLDAVAAGNPISYLDRAIDVDPTLLEGGHPWLPDRFPDTVPAEWTWGLAPAERLVAVLKRSLRSDTGAPDALRHRLSGIATRIDAVRSATTAALRERDLPADSTAAVVALADEVFTALQLPQTLAKLIDDAVTAYAEQSGPDPAAARRTAVEVLQAALCVEVDRGSAGATSGASSHPVFDFLRIGVTTPPDVLPLPELPPAAPGAPPIPPVPLSNVLYGSRLGHFAAFGRADWRRWDFLWGRIHAAVQLGALMGLKPVDLDEIVTSIVVAEGRSLPGVRAEMARVMALTPADIEADLRQDGVLRPAVDALFALLGSRVRTDPAAPVALRWVAAALALRAPRRLRLGQWAVRVYATPARSRLRKRLHI